MACFYYIVATGTKKHAFAVFWQRFRNSPSLWIITGLFCAYLVLLWFFNDDYPDVFLVLDQGLAILAFLFLIFEVIQLKGAVDVSEAAIQVTHKAITDNYQIINIAGAGGLISQIQENNRSRKFAFSVERLQELRRKIIHIERYLKNQGVKGSIVKSLEEKKRTISLQINQIDGKIGNSEGDIDSGVLNENLDSVLELLHMLESEISFKIPNQ